MKPLRIDLEKFACQLHISTEIDPIEQDWRQLSHDNVYADPNYLRLLEKNGPLTYRYAYGILHCEGKPVAAFYFQMKRIELLRDFRLHTHSSNALKRLNVFLIRQFFRFINQNLLVCGNVLLTGEYAFGTDRHFKLTDELIDEVMAQMKAFFRKEMGIKIQAILCKDFYKSGIHKELSFNGPGFYQFKVQPDMILQLDPSWKTFDDFLQAVRSKYRVKYKKVMRDAEPLRFLEMDIHDVQKYNDKMYALYEATAKRATFSLFYLDPRYFLCLKECFGDNIRITGIFKDEQLLGFYTFVINGKYGDAHFIGYDVGLNSDYQIYFNILLGLISKAIESGSSFLNLSRTALEIKSSVGAEPHDMFIYLRHENRFVNALMPMILNRVVPEEEWLPRSPFK